MTESSRFQSGLKIPDIPIPLSILGMCRNKSDPWRFYSGLCSTLHGRRTSWRCLAAGKGNLVQRTVKQGLQGSDLFQCITWMLFFTFLRKFLAQFFFCDTLSCWRWGPTIGECHGGLTRSLMVLDAWVVRSNGEAAITCMSVPKVFQQNKEVYRD